MPQGNDVPNVFRTDVRAYIVVNGKHYPASLVETMYRPDELPYAYMEIPMGRKAPKDPPTEALDLPGAGDLISKLDPMTPISIKVKCSAYGNPPDGKKKGYVDGQWMTIFSGYVLSPWIRKRRGGYAALALTAMGELGKLASSTNYVSSIVQGKTESTINVPAGVGSGVVQTVVEDVQKRLPADNISKAVIDMLQWLIKQPMAAAGGTNAANNAAAQSSIARLLAVSGKDVPTGFSISGGAAKNLGDNSAVDPAKFNKQLQWSVSRHLADLLYAGWANGLTDGGGDLWSVLQVIAKSFLFSVIPTARSNDYLVPMFYGLNNAAFRVIDPNEYWAVEIGKSFTPKDYAYVGNVWLYSPRADPVITVSDGHRGTGFQTPILGRTSNFAPRGGALGRLQIMECPTWAVPPANLVPEDVAKDKSLPDLGSPDDPNVKFDKPAVEFWYDAKLGDNIASWTLGFLEYVHRVIALTGRLRFDIAPGSLLQVNFKEDLYTKGDNAQYSLYGYVAEVRTSIGSRGRGTTAQTILTLSHVHNDTEHKKWPSSSHPVYNLAWTGTHLVDGADK